MLHVCGYVGEARGGRPGGRVCQATHITTFSYTKDLTRMVHQDQKDLLPFLETLAGPESLPL